MSKPTRTTTFRTPHRGRSSRLFVSLAFKGTLPRSGHWRIASLAWQGMSCAFATRCRTPRMRHSLCRTSSAEKAQTGRQPPSWSEAICTKRWIGAGPPWLAPRRDQGIDSATTTTIRRGRAAARMHARGVAPNPPYDRLCSLGGRGPQRLLESRSQTRLFFCGSLLSVREFWTIPVQTPMIARSTIAHSGLTPQGDLAILARMVDLRDESSYS